MKIKAITWKTAKFGFRNGYVGDLQVFAYGPNTQRRTPNLVLQTRLEGFTDRYWECKDGAEAEARATTLLASYVALFVEEAQ